MATENATAPQMETAIAQVAEANAAQAEPQTDVAPSEDADFSSFAKEFVKEMAGRKEEAAAESAPSAETKQESAAQTDPAVEPVTETAAPEATEAAQDAATAAPTAEQGKEAEKPKDEPGDETAKALARYVRGAKANRDEAARIKAEDARVKAEAAKVAEDRAKLESLLALKTKAEKDPAGAFEELIGKDRVNGDLLLQLLERANGGEGKPLSEEDRLAAIQEATLAKVKEDLRKEAEEKAKAKEKEEKAADERAWVARFGELSSYLEKSADKYPLMAVEGYDTAKMQQAIEAHRSATGQWPTMDQVLFHFEDILTKETERRYGILASRKQRAAEVPTAPAVKSPAAAPVKGSAVDSKGKPGKVINTKSVDERYEEILSRL